MENRARLTRTALTAAWIEGARAAKQPGLVCVSGLTSNGIGPAAPARSSSRSAARYSPRCANSTRSASRHRTRDGCEYKLPQLVLFLVLIDLDAGTLVRAGDTGDPSGLIAAGLDGSRGLARTGQELIDEVQRGVGRALCGARLILELLVRLVRLILLVRGLR